MGKRPLKEMKLERHEEVETRSTWDGTALTDSPRQTLTDTFRRSTKDDRFHPHALLDNSFCLRLAQPKWTTELLDMSVREEIKGMRRAYSGNTLITLPPSLL